MADFPSPTSAYGRWGLMDVRDAIMGGNWPTPAQPDPYFEYVSMLLPGNGTNGAQNNTFLDSSTNNFSITRNGNTTQGSFSPYGDNWSNNFIVGDYLTTPVNSTAFNFGTGAFQIEFWMYPTASPGQFMGPLATNNNGGTGGIFLANRSGYLDFVSNNDNVTLIRTTYPSLNSWHHVMIVRNSSNLRAMYVDGTRVGTANDVADFNQTQFQVSNYNATYGGSPGYYSNFRIIKGTNIVDPNSSTITVPTAPLTAVSGTTLLTCQNNRFFDASSNGFAITATGTPSVQRFSPFSPTATYSTSVIGGSGYFDGTGDYLSAANNTNIDVGTGAFTIEAWVYRIGGDADWRVMGGSVNSSGFFGGRAGKLGLGRSNVAWDLESSTNVYNNNAWTHIVYVRDGSGNLSIFANGVRVANTTGNSNNYGLNSGSLQVAAEQGGQTWIGYMSNFRLVKGTAVYSPTSTTLTVPTAPLTAVSGTGLLLAYINGAIFDNAMMNDLETVGNAQISTAVSKFGGGSMAFDGTGDYLYSPTTTQFNPRQPFTVEFWTYPNSVTTIAWINGNGSLFYIETFSGTLYVGDGTTNIIATSPPSTGAWTHVALSFDGTTYRLFYNGTSQATSTTLLLSNTLTAWYIGSRPDGSRPFNGYIDDLRITKGYARYTSNFTAPTAAFPTF